jgi:hypothetical protein
MKPLMTASLSVIAVMTITGCDDLFDSHSIETRQQAGTSHVAVVSVIPWESIEAELTPSFEIDEKSALAQALPITQRVISQMLKSVDIKVQAAIPKPDSSGTPSSDTPPSVNPKPAALGEDGKQQEPKGELAVDPILRYQAATSLLQEVRLLNRALKHVAIKKGYKANVVRMQISLLPKRRSLGYDAYTSVSFYPENLAGGTDGQPALMVIPAIATDNLEGSSALRTLQVIRSASLSIQGILGEGTGVSAGIGGRNDKSDSASGIDLNALLTVARPSNNTLRIRLGAVHQVGNRYAMLPRTHYVTFLILTQPSVRSVRAISRTSFVDVRTGEQLHSDESRLRESLNANVLEKLSAFDYKLNEDCSALAAETKYKSLELLRLLALGHYDALRSCLQKRNGGIDIANVAERIRLTRLVSSLLELLFDSEYGDVEFDVAA